jgi:hypothetical protein
MGDPTLVSAGFSMVRHACLESGPPKERVSFGNGAEWCNPNFNGTQRDGSVSLVSPSFLTISENSLSDLQSTATAKERPVGEILVICAELCLNF